MIWTAAALAILAVNVGYFVRKILDDWGAGQRGMAFLGAACLLGVNGIILGIIQASVASSTDL
ncbi:MAG TPA: hypothetical protein VGB70_05495 [Allosphingosinicella sp.]|jgi:hypothetical protein